MKTLIAALMILLFAIPILAQDPNPQGPEHFIWFGGGVDRYAPEDDSDRLATGVFGYGHRVAGSSYLVTNVVMTESHSTLSESFLQRITQQGPVALFIGGDLGVEAGNEQTNLSVGGSVLVDTGLGWIHKRLANFGIITGVKLLKDNDASVSNAVKPRFVGGIRYSFTK